MRAYQLGPLLAVDNNRDGQISLDASDATTQINPYHFWINDSEEGGDIVSGAEDQIPSSSSPNSNLNHVNGRSDLINFFPVALSLSNALQWLPLANGFEYHLVQNDSAVKFVYTSLTPTNAFDYLTNTTSTGYGVNLDKDAFNANTLQVEIAPGAVLDNDWLAQVQANGGHGVILVEGCTVTTKPLWLEIWKDGQLLGGVQLYLSIDRVENMYRHKNFRNFSDAPSGLVGDASVRDGDPSLPTSMNEPNNMPDSESNNRWFFFVVGSNVGGRNARGWESEVFKRMYWSGNKAKFVGVSWYGDPKADGNDLIYDYHMAVRNAFTTAPSLASFVNGLSGDKTIAGHSLGNGVIASAIADCSMNVNNACLVDAAFAQECFDGESDDNPTGMRPSWWQDYPEELWAAHWYERFDATDTRSTLTWRNRFAGAIGKVYSFYSSTEDALGEFDGTPGLALVDDAFGLATGNYSSYVWVLQEKCKGDKISLLGLAHVGSDYGGWGFNVFDGYLSSYPIWYAPVIDGRLPKTPAQIGTPTQDMLDGSRYNPLFKSGWGNYDGSDPAKTVVDTDTSYFTGPAWIMGLYTTSGGDTITSDPTKRTQLLAEAIPALSLPVGANETSALGSRNFNMPALFTDGVHWPRNIPNNVPEWRHSDIDNIAYPYIYKLFNQLVFISNQ